MATKVRACVMLLLLASMRFGIAQDGAGKQALAERELQAGRAALSQGRFAEAKQHFEAAARLGGPPPAQINAGIAIAELQMGHYAAAREREAVVLKLVTGAHERAEAHHLIGTAWFRESGIETARSDKLRAAEESFRRAVEIDPVFDAAFFSLGNVLLQQGRADEAGAAFKMFIDAAANNPLYAQDGAAAPAIAAAAFTVTDQTGHTLSSDSLRGRVVLLDFWATWCPPCIKALPAIRQLARYFPGDQFTLISVNEDSTVAAWQRFTQREKMDWAQVWDENANLYHNFRLAPRPDMSLPRYVLIDREGTVRRVFDGTDRLGLLMAETVRLAGGEPTAPHPPERKAIN